MPTIARLVAAVSCLLLLVAERPSSAQQPDRAFQPPPEVIEQLTAQLQPLSATVASLTSGDPMQNRNSKALVADVAIFEKAVDWQLRHKEFYKADYVRQTEKALLLGSQRAAELAAGNPSWVLQEGSTIRGYFSRVDQSVQPYALTLPAGVDPLNSKRWPLHVVLHGRANQMNEVNFISQFEGRKPKTPATWIQLDVYGRGSNAYRWAGETDVFEALADVQSRFRIDENRITLHGFSMGGAGAWHLGMHYPHLWSSVGPGAGFVDFYKYQKQSTQLPSWQHQTLGIYDAVDYALNAANVPVCTYGGELDPQLAASTTMAEAAAALDVDIKVIVGPGMGHKFDPESQKQFMAFHEAKSASGRPSLYDRKQIRFTTRTLRYNQCDWLTIEEVQTVYAPSTVEAFVNADGDVEITTNNVTALRITRDIATDAIIDGTVLPCRTAADGLLPDVYFQRSSDGWQGLDYDASRAFADNKEVNKRHGLQGPIDDAFMDAFVCVNATGHPLIPAVNDWAGNQLETFSREFDFWMRGKLPIINDVELTDKITASNHLILFGDPQSNSVLKLVLEKLQPMCEISWDQQTIRIGDQSWDTKTHALSMIYPNPLNPRRYVVINSGHSMHDADFKASNAWLFPRLGDIAVRRIQVPAGHNQKNRDGAASTRLDQSSAGIVWAANFNANWALGK